MRWGSLVGAGVAAVPATFLTWLFVIWYWLHRDCIAQALSGCYVVYADGSAASYTDGGKVWGVLALPFWALVAWLLWRAVRDEGHA